MNRIDLKRIWPLVFLLVIGFWLTNCAASKELKAPPKDRVYPLAEINLEKVFIENRGLKVLEENASTVDDYYRGGVQEKEEGERRMKDGRWEDARLQFEKSNRYFRVVLKYLPEDDASRNVYGEQNIIFLPNLLIADNDLKLITVYKSLKNDAKATEAKAEGQHYLAESLKSVKTEWAHQIQKGF